jgi:hypothetical protein
MRIPSLSPVRRADTAHSGPRQRSVAAPASAVASPAVAPGALTNPDRPEREADERQHERPDAGEPARPLVHCPLPLRSARHGHPVERRPVALPCDPVRARPVGIELGRTSYAVIARRAELRRRLGVGPAGDPWMIGHHAEAGPDRRGQGRDPVGSRGDDRHRPGAPAASPVHDGRSVPAPRPSRRWLVHRRHADGVRRVRTPAGELSHAEGPSALRRRP